jgi:membrane protein
VHYDGLMSPVRRTASVVMEAVNLWTSRNAFQHAGALAFYTLFSMAPLMIIIITIVGAVFGDEAAQGQIKAQAQDYVGEDAAEWLQRAVLQSRIEEAGTLPAILGVGALVFGATTVFAQMQNSLNQFWGVVAKPSRSGILVFLTTRLLSLGMVLVIGFLLLTSFVLSIVVMSVVEYGQQWVLIPTAVVSVIDIGLSLVTATLLFAMIFKILPDVHLHWADVWRSAGVTATLFVVGQYLISLYLTQTAPGSTYGAAGSLVLILMWVYYSSLILFLGTALTRAYIEQRGDSIRPKSTAVRVHLDIMEDDGGGMKKVSEVD